MLLLRGVLSLTTFTELQGSLLQIIEDYKMKDVIVRRIHVNDLILCTIRYGSI